MSLFKSFIPIRYLSRSDGRKNISISQSILFCTPSSLLLCSHMDISICNMGIPFCFITINNLIKFSLVAMSMRSTLKSRYLSLKSSNICLKSSSTSCITHDPISNLFQSVKIRICTGNNSSNSFCGSRFSSGICISFSRSQSSCILSISICLCASKSSCILSISISISRSQSSGILSISI